MSQYYYIKKETLTDIANAIRSKGKLTTPTELPIVRHTSNYDGASPPAGSLDFNTKDDLGIYNPDKAYKETIVINGAASLKVVVNGWLPYHPDVIACLTINGTALKANSTTQPSIDREITITGDTVNYEWWTSQGGQWFYYFEIHAYDASGEEMTTFNKVVGSSTATYAPSEMAAAISAIADDGSGTVGTGAEGIMLRALVEGTITSFDCEDIEAIGKYTFYNKTTLTSVSCPRVSSIGANAFSGCSNLTSVNLPQVTTFDGSYQFHNCSALGEICFPKLIEVTDNSFRYCSNLTKADFSEVTAFTGSCFFNSPNLTLIIRNKTGKATASSSSILPANFNGGIYVPKSLVASYKSDTVWKTWADKIYAIEDYPDICG